MKKQEIALTHFKAKNNCCQSVISAFIEDFNLDKQATLKLATGFGGGLCKGETCGAAAGAYMALGLKFGYTSLDDFEGKAITKEKVQAFDKLFIEKYGTLQCEELLGCNVNTKEGQEYAIKHNLIQTKCAKYIEGAVIIAEQLVND